MADKWDDDDVSASDDDDMMATGANAQHGDNDDDVDDHDDDPHFRQNEHQRLSANQERDARRGDRIMPPGTFLMPKEFRVTENKNSKNRASPETDESRVPAQR